MNEAQMRRALGLNDAPKARPIAITPGLTVVLSVREKYGGPTLPFSHKTKTLSRLLAQMEAEQVARKQGYVVWALLDIA